MSTTVHCPFPADDHDGPETPGTSHGEFGQQSLASSINLLEDAQLGRAHALCRHLTTAYLRHNSPLTARDPEAHIPADYTQLLGALPEIVWIELASALDVTIFRAHTIAGRAFGVTATMPLVHALTVEHRLGFTRLEYASGKTATLPLGLRGEFDALVSDLDAAWEWKRWKKAVDDIFAALLPPEDALDDAQRNRRVRFWNNGDGTGCLQYTGPIADVTAAWRRSTAWAHAIALSHASLFTDPETGRRLDHATAFDEERSIDQLRFDLGLFTIPTLPLEVLAADGSRRSLQLQMPTACGWLRRQATVCVTIPFLSLIGESELPGHFDDASPVSAADARRIAACAPSMRRLLTDPATGRVIEAVARTYAIPQALRTTVNARWVWCTVPGCSRRATSSDTDHITPFNRSDPARGGPTQLDNLHPLCRRHHLHKTKGLFAVERVGDEPDGSVRWTFPAPLVGPVDAPCSHIDIEHARRVAQLCRGRSEEAGRPSRRGFRTVVPDDPSRLLAANGAEPHEPAIEEDDPPPF